MIRPIIGLFGAHYKVDCNRIVMFVRPQGFLGILGFDARHREKALGSCVSRLAVQNVACPQVARDLPRIGAHTVSLEIIADALDIAREKGIRL